MKKFLCVLTVLLCVTGIMCACEANITPTVTPSDDIISPTPTPAESLPTSITEFKIIYPEEDFSQTIYYKDIAFVLRAKLLTYGVSVKLGTDTVDEENGLIENKYEILIGPTNRIQSETVSNDVEIRQDDYIIRFTDNKIVIFAGSENAYNAAAEHFADMCNDNGLFDCTFEQIAAINEKFVQGNSPDGFFVDGVSLENYKIVSSLSDEKNSELIKKIKTATGYILELGSSETATEYEIVIGNVARAETDEAKKDLRDLDYAVKIINGKVIITGGSSQMTNNALELFVENFLETKVSKKEYTAKNDVVIKHDYPVKSIKLLGCDISEYVIFAKGENDTAAQNIRKYINDITGIKLDIVTNGNPQKAIVLGNAQTKQYKELTANLKSDEYIIKSVGTKIYLGTNDDYYEDGPAVNIFLANYLGFDIETGTVKSDTVEIDNFDECAEINDYLMKKADDAFIAEVDAKADALRNEILNTKTDITYSGTAYYVSKGGNDENDGLTPETSWASLDRVTNATELKSGDAVFFNRGDIFRGGLGTVEGVTYSAYGEGEKPRIYGSPFDGAKYGTWEEVAPNVYRYSKKFSGDVGLITMNNSEYWTVKILQDFRGETPVNHVTREPFTSYTDMKEDLTFWYDFGTSYKSTLKEGYVYLCSTEGNPSERFYNIEFNVSGNIIGCAKNVTIDNLCIMYGGSHGINADDGTTVQNCVVGWIGGCIQGYGSTGEPTRFGNGIEAWGSVSDYTVRHCYVYQCYDAGVTHQGGDGVMENITYADNLLEYNIYNIEYFMAKPSKEDEKSSYMKNILIENNMMRYAGYGWGMQRPDHISYNIQSWTHWNRQLEEDSYFIIRNNIMQYAVHALVCTHCDEPEWEVSYENNVFIQKTATERKENPTNSLWGYADPYYWTYNSGTGQSGTMDHGNYSYYSRFCYDGIAIDAFVKGGNVFYRTE